jgi:hypothetical protein
MISTELDSPNIVHENVEYININGCINDNKLRNNKYIWRKSSKYV